VRFNKRGVKVIRPLIVWGSFYLGHFPIIMGGNTFTMGMGAESTGQVK